MPKLAGQVVDGKAVNERVKARLGAYAFPGGTPSDELAPWYEETRTAIPDIVASTLAIGLTDNLLRPILIGRETRIPDYLVLVATLGGLSAFGLAGFVAGPVVEALAMRVTGGPAV